MVIDLLLLSVIGFVLELLCTRLLHGLVLPGTSFMFLSLLIVFIAIARWNLFGLIIVPIICLATMVGGSLIDIPKLRDIYSFTYDWQLYVSMVIGYLPLGINVLFYKKDTKKIISSPFKMMGLCLLDYIIFSIVQLFAYRCLTCNGDILHQGQLVNSLGQVYICNNIESGAVYNLFGFTIAIIGLLILRSQGAVANVKQKLIEDKKNAELDLMDMNFRIEEVEVDSNQQKEEPSNDEEKESSNEENVE